MALEIRKKDWFVETPGVFPSRPGGEKSGEGISALSLPLRHMRKAAESGNIQGFQKQFQQFKTWASQQGFDFEADLETRVALTQMELKLKFTAAKRAISEARAVSQKGTEAQVTGDENLAQTCFQKATRWQSLADALLAELRRQLGS